MKHLMLISLCFIYLSSTGQNKLDTLPNGKPAPKDSVMSYPDSVVIKIPKNKMPLFSAILGGQDFSHKEYLEFLGIIDDEVKPQLIKKPS